MSHLLFFGMPGQFSAIPLQQLLNAEMGISAPLGFPPLNPTYTLRAVIVPGRGRDKREFPRQVKTPSSTLPILNLQAEPDLVSLALERQIPVWEVASLSDPQTLALLADFRPDLIVIACFPYLFPPALLALPRHGCLNLHPSLLPAYRGPIPFFWIARQDERRTGVTLHFLDEGVDTGDIVAQTTFDRPEGISEAELERRCAVEGARLLRQALQQLEQEGTLPRRPQPEQGASYFSWPCDDDLIVTPDWPVQRAFNFMRGAAGWSPVIQIGEQTFSIRAALSYSTGHTLEQPYLLLGNELWVQFEGGVLRAQL